MAKKTKLFASVAVIGLSLSALGAVPALAQDNGTDDSGKTNASEGDSDFDNGEILVTAQLRSQRLSDVPLAIQAQTGETLAELGVIDSRSLERIAPQLSFSNGYNTSNTSFSMRGVISLVASASVQPSVGVLLDEMPAARQGEVVLDLADIDRVEILSGPQGTLFGKNATAGVVRIISNRPVFGLEGNAEISATTDEQYTLKGMINLPLSDSIALRVNGFVDDMQPIVENIHPQGPDGFDNEAFGIQGKLLFKVSDSTDFMLTANYREFDGGNAPAMVIIPISGPVGDLQRAVLGDAVGYGKDIINHNTRLINEGESFSIIAQIDSDLSDNLNFQSITGYRYFTHNAGPDTDTGPIGVSRTLGLAPNPLGYPIGAVEVERPQVLTYKYWSQEFRLNYSGNGIDIVGGVFYQNYDETYDAAPSNFILGGAYVGQDPASFWFTSFHTIAEISNDTGAIFADATVEVTPTITLFGGLRYTIERLRIDRYTRDNFFAPVGTGPGFFDPDNYGTVAEGFGLTPVAMLNLPPVKETYHNLSGRAGIQWQPQDNLNYYASFNRGYKGPATTFGSSVSNSNDLIFEPEIATAFELGGKQRFLNGMLSLDFSIYTQEIENIQITAVPPGTVAPALINAGSIETTGFEISATARPSSDLTFNLGFVYNDAKYSGDFSSPCLDANTPNCRADGTINLDGTRAVGVPEYKVTASAFLDTPITPSLDLNLGMDGSYRSSIQYQLQHDPRTAGEGYAIVNASIGVESSDDRWEITAFVRNLTNKFNYAYFFTADGFIGQQFGYVPRDYKRYGGVRARFSF